MAEAPIFRNRVIGLRTVPAGELLANPKNWRLHPPEQQTALRAMMERIGNASAVVARETPEGLELIDGHLRKELAADQPVSVLVVDLNAEEADMLLASMDPLAAMAQADAEKLEELLAPLHGMPEINYNELYGIFSEEGNEGAWPTLPPESDQAGEMTFQVTEAQREIINRALNAERGVQHDGNANGATLTRWAEAALADAEGPEG